MMLALQRAAGNRAVQQLVQPASVQRASCCASCGSGGTCELESSNDAVPVQREDEASDPAFQNQYVEHAVEGTSCTPYDNFFIAQAMKHRMQAQLLPSVLAATQSWTNVRIWDTYLDGGGQMTFSDTDNPGDPLVRSVRGDEGQVDDAVAAVVTHVEGRLESLANERLRERDSIQIPVEELVPPELLHPRLEWKFPPNPAANVIGEIGASDVYRRDNRLIGGTITLIKQHRQGDRLTVDVRASCELTITVNDSCDFCPGNIGPVWEQNFTIPLSRLEATGLAGDVKLTVTLHERRSTGLVNLRDPAVEG